MERLYIIFGKVKTIRRLLETCGIVEHRKVKMLCWGCNGRIIWVAKRHFLKAYKTGELIICERCGQMLRMAIKERINGDKA